jgi:methylated-DNA-[protein]-cysteine S-methyltransferase
MKFSDVLFYTTVPSPLGLVVLAATDQALVGLWFDGQRHQPDASRWQQAAAHPLLALAGTQLSDYLAGRRSQFELPLSLAGGSAFEQAVWRALQDIPRGGTCSYSALAAAIGRPKAARAVGAAVGRNPLSIIVPCHRVLGTGGALTGYAGGLPRKVSLLQLEGAAFAPTPTIGQPRRPSLAPRPAP